MNVMITAGGTVEKIDSVRSISNFSTGKLGSLTADSFSALPDVKEIYYLCGKTSILPKSDKAKIIYVDTVESLEKTVTDILCSVDIDIIIHSMAVSDYRVKSVISLSDVISSLASGKDGEDITTLFNKALREKNSGNTSSGNKISSDIEDLLLVMEKTPKVISLFQKLSPKSVLVGFKLLNAVSLETLIDTGFRILQENKCCFVLANDLSEISDTTHIGYLIDSNKNYQRFCTKQDIADAIVSATRATTEKRSK